MRDRLAITSILRDGATPVWSIRHRWVWLTAIFVLALVVRLAVISQMSVQPTKDLLWNDAVAWNLAQGHGFTASQSEPYVPGVFRTPGYPAFIAAVYYVFGHSYNAAFAFQAVLDALSAVVITLVGFNLMSLRVSLIGGFLYALYPYSAFFCGVLSQDILLTLTVLVALYLTTQVEASQPKLWRWLLVGLAIGVAALVKAFIILYVLVPALLVFVAVRGLRPKIAAFAMLGLGIALVISPWIVRNYVLFESFPPLAAGATGTNLNLIVQELDGGEEELMRQIDPTSHSHATNSQYLSEFSDGRSLIESEKELAKAAYPEIMRRKTQYLLLVMRHIPRLWLTRSAVGQGHGKLMAILAMIVSVLYLIPGILGMYMLRSHWRRLLPLFGSIILLTLIYAPYTTEARYTLPARPVMMIFVAATICVIARRLQDLISRKARVEPTQIETGAVATTVRG